MCAKSHTKFFLTWPSYLNHTKKKIYKFVPIFLLLLAFKCKYSTQVWCDFARASSLICGNKLPTRCNRDFYCTSYCLLNMFRAQICPSAGAQEYYTVVAACGISCCGFQVAGLVWSWGLFVRFAGCWLSTGFPMISQRIGSWNAQA